MKKAFRSKKIFAGSASVFQQPITFHGSLYPIQEGATYNAYLVVDDEVTLFDTVEEEFAEEMLERIRSVIGDRPVDNIIVQHAEPDHSGGFLHVMRAYPQARSHPTPARTT